ncbi:MAG: hypothetical protein HDR77_09725 [Bacteroides sp.]|nr:hypothetical protein [Bacteroides sp.]MBD5375731.1 hypothetical protein [Bacteroides sp.]
MKKLILSVAVVAAAAFVACTSSKTSDSAAAITSKIENCTNADSLKTYVNQAKEYVQTLVNEGKLEEAKAYLAKIEPIVKEKAPALAGALTSVESAIDKVGDMVSTDKIEATADSTKQAVADSISAKVDDTKDAIGEAVSDTKESFSEKVSHAVENGKEAVGNAAEKSKEAVGNAAEKSKEAVSNAAEKSKEAVSNTAEKAKDAASDAAKKAVDKLKNL